MNIIPGHFCQPVMFSIQQVISSFNVAIFLSVVSTFPSNILNLLVHELVISYISQEAFRRTPENVTGLVIFSWIMREASEKRANSSIDNISLI